MRKADCIVLTYNIFHDLPAFRQLDRRLDLIAAGIAAHRPHLVALQEVSRSFRCGNVGAALCSRVNARCGGEVYQLDYARADGVGDGEFAIEDGLALMSRLEPRAAVRVVKFEAQVRIAAQMGGHQYRLPDDRIALLSRYRLAGGVELEACVTHLTDRRDTVGGVPVRLEQARELVRWLAQCRDRSLPLVLGGDFNDVPDSETIRAILAAGFIDLWEASATGAGYTNDSEDIDIEAAHGAPNQRIDYLFFAPGGARNFDLADARLFLDRPSTTPEGGYLWGSDHIGVMAKIRL